MLSVVIRRVSRTKYTRARWVSASGTDAALARHAAELSRRRFLDPALRIDLVELDGHPLADALLLHRDAVELVGDRHRALGVRDHDELALLEELLHDQVEAAVVGLVQRRVDLVEDAERAGLALEDAHQQRDAGHRLLAAGELADRRGLLARRVGHDLDAGLEDVDLLLLRENHLPVGPRLRLSALVLDLRLQVNVRLPTPEQLAEHALEMLADG